MSVTIKVKNETAAGVDVTLDGKPGKITIAAGAEADLDAQYLGSKSFENLLAAGKVSLSEDPATTADQFKLGRLLLPGVLNRLASRHVALHGTLVKQKKDLGKLRDGYNQNWTPVHATVESAKNAAIPAKRLLSGTKFFLSTKPEQDAVDKVKAEIATLEAEDLSVTHRTVVQWYADRQAKQAELDKAQKALDAVKTQVIKPLADLIANLEKASTDFDKADPTKDVGAPIPAF